MFESINHSYACDPVHVNAKMIKSMATTYYCQIDGDSDELRVNGTICQKLNI